MKIHPVGAELFHMDRHRRDTQMDRRDEPNIALRNLRIHPKRYLNSINIDL